MEPSRQLAMSTRPLFATSMKGFGVCFNGYKDKGYKSDLKKWLFWIHSLGGRVLRDIECSKPKVGRSEGRGSLFYAIFKYKPL